MAIQVQGFSGIVAEVDGSLFRALRVTLMPVDYGSLGIYGVSGITGIMAAGLAANAEIQQFRWTDATRLALIYAIDFDGAGGIVAFAAGVTQFSAVIARGWTVAGGGGATLTITGNNQKLRTAMGTTLLGEFRQAATAALTAGTKTLDANPLGSAVSSTGVTAGTPLSSTQALFNAANADNMPIVLAQNEGVIVRATVPATGTWTAGVSWRWAEVTSY